MIAAAKWSNAKWRPLRNKRLFQYGYFWEFFIGFLVNISSTFARIWAFSCPFYLCFPIFPFIGRTAPGEEAKITHA